MAIVILACNTNAQNADPAYVPLEKAYNALRVKDYDTAIQNFRSAVALAPSRASIRKDLAYALLRIGENESARDQFAEAMRLNPADEQSALDYAFLCNDTKQQATARRVFDRLRKKGSAKAEEAFQSIDRSLVEGIARWQKAIELAPDNFSNHQELAKLAEQRDDIALAAEHYEKAWRLKPDDRSLLLDLGRTWKVLKRPEDAMSALLAASRGASPRIAEEARDLLPSRYPYLYEFQRAIALDIKNVGLRREFAYLLLEMGKKPEAEEQFRTIHTLAPADLLSAAQLGFLLLNRGDSAEAQPLLEQVLKGGDEELAERVRAALKLPQNLKHRNDSSQNKTRDDAKAMAEKSLKSGYLKDAVKYLRVVHEADPSDFDTVYKLGWVANVLHDDREAMRWFEMASKSPDPAIASEATQAYNNLKPEFSHIRTTVWMFPFFSTRWHDTFGYGQVKTAFRLGSAPLWGYLSMRIVGDVRGTTAPTASNPLPQYLSESAAIFGFGLTTAPWHGLTAWAEAGEAMKYLVSRKDVGLFTPDYRGGLSFGKGLGHLMGGKHGFYAETNDDAVFVSRFQNDTILYSQNRTGYTFPKAEAAGNFQAQFYWNYNVTVDRLRQYWANFAETGPGVRFQARFMPKGMLVSVNALRGVYLVNEGNPRRPNFYDLRAGFWYAFTH
ncbi:MAG TPA: tetratricopeptide repeat protein [Bryobacteraceae bacterium]|nr:tetratricopeptide repeat protein [Bryobacteraceae bacterium]